MNINDKDNFPISDIGRILLEKIEEKIKKSKTEEERRKWQYILYDK